MHEPQVELESRVLRLSRRLKTEGRREREREREKRKPSEFSLTVIISTLCDGSGAVKKRRRKVKPNRGCCCRGPVVSCLIPTPPNTHTHSAPPYPKNERREGAMEGEKGQRKQTL